MTTVENNKKAARLSGLTQSVMAYSPSLLGSSSVVFDGTSAYVIPTCDFNPEEEELIRTFKCLKEAEVFCEEYSQDI